MRSDIYKTDCKCKVYSWKLLSDAISHLETCTKATAVYYNSPYGEAILVREVDKK